jgi:hypothetical protein
MNGGSSVQERYQVMRDDGAQVVQRSPVLADVEACRRRTLLITLQEALAVRGVRSLLVGRHVLALRATAPFEPSGPADPELHVLSGSCREVVTTDGLVYQLDSGRALPADDPAAVAERLTIAR